MAPCDPKEIPWKRPKIAVISSWGLSRRCRARGVPRNANQCWPGGGSRSFPMRAVHDVLASACLCVCVCVSVVHMYPLVN